MHTEPPSGVFRLEREQEIPREIHEVFAFFVRAENLEAITPPWLSFRILRQSTPEIVKGTLVEYQLKWRFVPLRWRTEIVEWEPPLRFVDVQVSGPYRLWHHRHEFAPRGRYTLMRDTVDYSLPGGMIGRLMHRLAIHRDIQAIFDYRARKIRGLFAHE